jgi:ABC-type dipeptide/oligopeptide/nickel transport system permease component
MARYLAHRVFRSAAAILGILVVVFFILHLTGDPVRLMLPPQASEEDYVAMKKALGMDKPLGEQFVHYMLGALHGDFGKSLRFRGQSAMELVTERFPATVQLALAALAISVALSLPLGVIAAVRRHSLWDNLAMTLALVGQAMPNFWLALLFISVFAVKLRWLPSSGRSGPDSLILPALTLALFMVARTTRLVRSSLLEVMGEDYIRTARGKGLAEVAVILRHALRNAALPVVTIIGLDLGTLMGGAVVTETVFAWPGIGFLAVGSIYVRDFPVVQAVVFFTALFFVVINLAVDLLYSVLDPRIRVA